MTPDHPSLDQPRNLHRPHVSAALSISLVSIAWTVLASTAAVVVGVRTGTAVLVAFGAIGTVDAIGSIALSYHFHHGLRHDALSEQLERLAHRLVLLGLCCVGCAAVVGGGLGLVADHVPTGSDVGVALAAASLVALVGLSVGKQRIARRIASAALRSDGHLSAVGAMQAAVTLGATVTTRWLGGRWADSVATMLIGCVAVVLAFTTWRTERAGEGDRGPRHVG